MNQYVEINSKFQAYLREYTGKLEQEISTLARQSRQDEAKHTKARLNVAGILEKMFLMCLKNLQEGVTNPTLLASIDPASGKSEQLRAGYLAICGNITAPWRQRLQQAKKFNDIDGAAIEEAKLDTADTILNAFSRIMAEGGRGNAE